MKILIVDDEKNIRLTLATCLEQTGYQADPAEDGEEALAKVASDEYDLVFLDMKMPGINGIETLRLIKQNAPLLHVVMMTAYGTIESAVEAMKLGAVDYLRKPFSPGEVREIAARIDKRRLMEADEVQSYESIVEYAKERIVNQDYRQAKEWLHKAVAAEPAKPVAYNLLGVMAEMENQIQLAQRMYRAALSVDPSYTPATNNLDRSAQWRYTQAGIDLGKPDAE